VQQQIFNCPRCGWQNVAGQQFCANCGSGLGGGGQQQAYNPQQWYSCPIYHHLGAYCFGWSLDGDRQTKRIRLLAMSMYSI